MSGSAQKLFLEKNISERVSELSVQSTSASLSALSVSAAAGLSASGVTPAGHCSCSSAESDGRGGAPSYYSPPPPDTWPHSAVVDVSSVDLYAHGVSSSGVAPLSSSDCCGVLVREARCDILPFYEPAQKTGSEVDWNAQLELRALALEEDASTRRDAVAFALAVIMDAVGSAAGFALGSEPVSAPGSAVGFAAEAVEPAAAAVVSAALPAPMPADGLGGAAGCAAGSAPGSAPGSAAGFAAEAVVEPAAAAAVSVALPALMPADGLGGTASSFATALVLEMVAAAVGRGEDAMRLRSAEACAAAATARAAAAEERAAAAEALAADAEERAAAAVSRAAVAERALALCAAERTRLQDMSAKRHSNLQESRCARLALQTEVEQLQDLLASGTAEVARQSSAAAKLLSAQQQVRALQAELATQAAVHGAAMSSLREAEEAKLASALEAAVRSAEEAAAMRAPQLEPPFSRLERILASPPPAQPTSSRRHAPFPAPRPRQAAGGATGQRTDGRIADGVGQPPAGCPADGGAPGAVAAGAAAAAPLVRGRSQAGSGQRADGRTTGGAGRPPAGGQARRAGSLQGGRAGGSGRGGRAAHDMGHDLRGLPPSSGVHTRFAEGSPPAPSDRSWAAVAGGGVEHIAGGGAHPPVLPLVQWKQARRDFYVLLERRNADLARGAQPQIGRQRLRALGQAVRAADPRGPRAPLHQPPDARRQQLSVADRFLATYPSLQQLMPPARQRLPRGGGGG